MSKRSSGVVNEHKSKRQNLINWMVRFRLGLNEKQTKDNFPFAFIIQRLWKAGTIRYDEQEAPEYPQKDSTNSYI